MLALIALDAVIPASEPVSAAGPWYVAPGGNDSNDCLSPSTPCATINWALAKPGFVGGDSILVATGTYTGTGNEVVLLNKNATLSGGWDDNFTTQSGVSTIDGEWGTGGAGRRGITVASNVAATVQRFVVQNGNDLFVATILNSGDLTLNDSTVRSTATDNGARGIYNSSSATLTVDRSIIAANTSCGICNDGGTATVNNSTVSGNIASGIVNSGTLVLINSTVSGNVASAWSNHGGGGIFNNGGTLDIDNSTVSDNLAVGGYSGGGVLNSGGTVTFNSGTISENEVIGGGSGGGISSTGAISLQNTILSGNFADIGPDCSGAIASGGFNLTGDTADCSFSPADGDLSNVDPKLGKLIGTPGEPKYHPLLASSPAIDAGNPAGCTDHLDNVFTTDQRGAGRVGVCDIGSYEFTLPGSPDRIYAYGGTPQRAPPLFDFEEPLQAVVLDASGGPADIATVDFSAPSSGASGTFSDSGTSTTSVPTNESGLATAATFTANQVIGSYVVEASVGGVGAPANFDLTNISWYVSTGGDDANDCQSPVTTCASINGALAKPTFEAGDTVYVDSGTYNGTGSEVVLIDKDVSLSGGWDSSFNTQSGNSTIDGEGSRAGINIDWWITVNITHFNVQRGAIVNSGTVSLEHCTIRDNTAPYSNRVAVYNGLGSMTLDNCTVTENDVSGIDNMGGTLILHQSTVSANDGHYGIRNEGSLTISDSTISGNSAIGLYTGFSKGLTLNDSTVSSNMNGGIYSSGGIVTLNDSTVIDNVATGHDGGGIAVFSNGTTTLNNSIIDGNSAGRGGGIFNDGTLTLYGTTISNNSTPGNGGGIYTDRMLYLNNSTVSGNSASQGGGIYGWGGTFNLSSSTITDNTATSYGGGIFKGSGSDPNVKNSIIAGNSTTGVGPDCRGTIISLGYNLIGDTSGCTFVPVSGDLTDIDPLLGPLQDNGGPTFTHDLPLGSPAINAGNPAGCEDHLGNPLSTDQRGSPRVQRCDIGAYEYQGTISQVFLPLITRDFCADFFDDFTNPSSGWAVVDDAFVWSEYLDGEFRVLSKQAGYFYYFTAPTCSHENYAVEVDARWVGIPGQSYGLIFGVLADFSQFYLFDINTDYRQFRLYKRDPGGFTTIVPITSSSAINGGTASNHLEVIRNGDQITLEVNGTVLGTWTDGNIAGLTFVGIISSPYFDIPTSDVRFDNFSVSVLPGGGAGVQDLSGAVVEAGGTEAPGAGQVEVPSEIERWMKEDDVELESE